MYLEVELARPYRVTNRAYDFLVLKSDTHCISVYDVTDTVAPSCRQTGLAR